VHGPVLHGSLLQGEFAPSLLARAGSPRYLTSPIPPLSPPSPSQVHGDRCTEAFYRKHVHDVLKLEGGGDGPGATKERMLEALVRQETSGSGGVGAPSPSHGAPAFRRDAVTTAAADDDDDDSEARVFSGHGPADEAARALAGVALSDGPALASAAAALSPAARAALWRAAVEAPPSSGGEREFPSVLEAAAAAVSAGAHSSSTSTSTSLLLGPLRPWWTESAAHHALAVAAAASAAPEQQQQQQQQEEEDNEADGAPPRGGPLPSPCLRTLAPDAALPPASALLRGKAPSPALAFHALNVLFAYAHTYRLYGGDWEGDAVGAAAVLLDVSAVLSRDERFPSAGPALSGALEASQGPHVRLSASAADARAPLGVLADVGAILAEPHFVVDALLHSRTMVQDALREVKREEEVGSDAVGASASAQAGGARAIAPSDAVRVLQGAERKLHFFSCWAQESLVARDESMSPFDRIAAGLEGGRDACARLRADVFASLDERMALLREASKVVRRTAPPGPRAGPASAQSWGGGGVEEEEEEPVAVGAADLDGDEGMAAHPAPLPSAGQPTPSFADLRRGREGRLRGGRGRM
jgi:hypothetical protein